MRRSNSFRAHIVPVSSRHMNCCCIPSPCAAQIAISIHVKVLQLGSRSRMTIRAAVCAQGTAPTRRARASVPHVARLISLMKFLTRYCTFCLSIARYPNTPTRLRNQDFCSSETGSSPSPCHCRVCYTVRLRTVQVTHVDSLFGLTQTADHVKQRFSDHHWARALQVPNRTFCIFCFQVCSNSETAAERPPDREFGSKINS